MLGAAETEQVRPCPWCGIAGQAYPPPSVRDKKVMVGCFNARCRMNPKTRWFDWPSSAEECFLAWNIRYDDAGKTP